MDSSQSTLLIALLAGSAVFFAYMLTLGMYWWRQRMKLSFILYRGLFFACVVVAFAYVIGSAELGAQLSPLADWWRISEIGYQALWAQVARSGAPFMLLGFWLPFAYRKMNSFGKVSLFAALTAILLCVAEALLNRLDIDDAIYAFWGVLAGFSVLCVLAGLVPRLKVFVSMGFGKYAYVIGAFLLMGSFFVGVGTLFANNGPAYVELQFAQSQPLPDNTVISTSLNTERQRVSTYEFVQADVASDAKRVAEAMGMQGEVQLEGSNQGIGVVQDGEKTLTLYSAGNWDYSDAAAERAAGAVPDDNTAERLARQIASNGAAVKYEVYSARVESREDENGAETGKLVWLTAATPGGARIVAACEFKILIGPGGNVVSVNKYDSDFTEYKKERIISSQDAYDLVLSGGLRDDGKEISVSHTLYSEASSVNITQAEVAYWLEGAKGILQPIWLFSATATLADGSSAAFEIYVPAIRY